MAASKVELSFTVGPNNTLTVQLPDNSNILTPGNWMLFAINNKGTPSVASIVQIDIGGELHCASKWAVGNAQWRRRVFRRH